MATHQRLAHGDESPDFDVTIEGLPGKIDDYAIPNEPVYHQHQFSEIPDTGHGKNFKSCFRC